MGAESGAPSADEVVDDEQHEPRGYMYAATRPTRYDEAGKVTTMDFWTIQCGPLSEPKRSETVRRRSRTARDEPAEALSSVTDRPFPGLTVIEDNCIAESVEALRSAAVLSENLGTKHKSHWVRDGWR